jgi:hypothetical protein
MESVFTTHVRQKTRDANRSLRPRKFGIRQFDQYLTNNSSRRRRQIVEVRQEGWVVEFTQRLLSLVPRSGSFQGPTIFECLHVRKNFYVVTRDVGREMV